MLLEGISPVGILVSIFSCYFDSLFFFNLFEKRSFIFFSSTQIIHMMKAKNGLSKMWYEDYEEKVELSK